MDASVGVLFEEGADRALLTCKCSSAFSVSSGAWITEWMHQLQFGVVERDEHCGDTVLGQRQGLADRGTQLAIELGEARQISSGDGNVIHTAQQRHQLKLNKCVDDERHRDRAGMGWTGHLAVISSAARLHAPAGSG